jgi:hypothetical protein
VGMQAGRAACWRPYQQFACSQTGQAGKQAGRQAGGQLGNHSRQACRYAFRVKIGLGALDLHGTAGGPAPGYHHAKQCCQVIVGAL